MTVPAGQAKTPTLLEWFPEFLRQELAPYPGRKSLVCRMVIAAVLSMIVIVTFRIPYGAIGVNCAFILSRENLVSTAKSGFYFILAFAAWAVLTPVGARMFASIPMTHFLWEGVTVFLCFYLLKSVAYFPLAAGIVVVATGTLAIWYLPGPAELNVELTLWQILATAIGALITLLVEVVFHYFAPSDPLLDGLEDRLQSVEEMFRTFDSHHSRTNRGTLKITKYAMTGSSMLHQQIARSHRSAEEQTKWNTIVSLVGHSVDIGAAIATDPHDQQDLNNTERATMQERIEAIRGALYTNVLRRIDPQPATWEPTHGLFVELGKTLELIESVLTAHPLDTGTVAASNDDDAKMRFLVNDAFSNPEYLRFALAGTAASMLCYVVYVGLNWPGISTAVTTCILTALSDVGASRQKQILRIGGASVGGFVFGLGSQILILPYIDSIVGLSLLFAAVTGISAYVATSSPRLSYAGLQMAFAFYLINVTDFSISLDLTIGRDRAVGVLLGIGAMWLVFERLYHRPAAPQMIRLLARSARLMARLRAASTTNGGDNQPQPLRGAIAASLAGVNTESDAVLFETGPDRDAYLVARIHVRSWLTRLRTIYLLELPLLPVASTQGIAVSVPPPVAMEWSEPLLRIAEHLESQIDSRGVSGINDAKYAPFRMPHPPAETDGPDQEVTRLLRSLEQDVLKQPLFEAAPAQAKVA